MRLTFVSDINSKPKDQLDMLPKPFWHDLSAPFTDIPDGDEFEDEPQETTTHDPYPFFEEPSTMANVTTQLASNVVLHCKVNDLRGKTVRVRNFFCSSFYRAHRSMYTSQNPN